MKSNVLEKRVKGVKNQVLFVLHQKRHAFAYVRFSLETRRAIFTFSKIGNAWITRQEEEGDAREAYQKCRKGNFLQNFCQTLFDAFAIARHAYDHVQ